MIIRRLILSVLIALSAIGFIWPFLVSSHSLAHKASWFFLAVAPVALYFITVLVGQENLGSKNIAFLGVLTALIASLRPLGIGAIGIEPMWFALILASRAMGPSFGFLLGGLSMLLSALLTGGIGPWLSYQVCAAAIIGWGIIVIPQRLRGSLEIVALAIYGVISAEFFGIAMDLQFWPWALGSGTELSYRAGAAISENVGNFFHYHFLSSMAWDLPRAIITVSLIVAAGKPVLSALRRARQKAAFVTEIELREVTL
jgi:energy-coupling factor transport system substrate-specific component